MPEMRYQLDWRPLEAVIAPDECEHYMYMAHAGSIISPSTGYGSLTRAQLPMLLQGIDWRASHPKNLALPYDLSSHPGVPGYPSLHDTMFDVVDAIRIP